MKNNEELRRKLGMTGEQLDAWANEYESGDYPSGGGEVFTGSHLVEVGKKRVTVIYDARDAQRVEAIVRSKGIKTSDVYRDALNYYLASQK